MNANNNTVKFLGKAFISGKILVKTGLHIGGSKSSLDIGGLDLSVIKTADGEVPFIPGSSLKGKLRSLLAREVGSKDVSMDKSQHEELFEIFGFPAESEAADENREAYVAATRLLVRDAFLNQEPFKNEAFQNLDFEYTEEKWENTIERTTGKAQHPRQLERVPAGAEFQFSLVYTVFDDLALTPEASGLRKCDWHLEQIRKAMRYLQDDYLGGHGSRGYGQIEFRGVELKVKTVQDYEGSADAQGSSIPDFWKSEKVPSIYETMKLD